MGNDKKFSYSAVIRGRIFVWSADDYDALIRAIYADAKGPDAKLDVCEAIVITDQLEAATGKADPDLFSWTQGIKPNET
jgi:hypothetical protein